jgi:hypothetical protein
VQSHGIPATRKQTSYAQSQMGAQAPDITSEGPCQRLLRHAGVHDWAVAVAVHVRLRVVRKRSGPSRNPTATRRARCATLDSPPRQCSCRSRKTSARSAPMGGEVGLPVPQRLEPRATGVRAGASGNPVARSDPARSRAPRASKSVAALRPRGRGPSVRAEPGRASRPWCGLLQVTPQTFLLGRTHLRRSRSLRLPASRGEGPEVDVRD